MIKASLRHSLSMTPIKINKKNVIQIVVHLTQRVIILLCYQIYLSRSYYQLSATLSRNLISQFCDIEIANYSNQLRAILFMLLIVSRKFHLNVI